MANNKRIDNILKYSSDLSLKVKNFSWGEDYLDGLYDYRIKTNLFGEEVVGVGIDKDENTAFLKAFSESVERSYCKENGVGSHGVSAHWDLDKAKNCSKNELIERDIFLCHYLSGSGSKIINNEKLDNINRLLSENSRQIKLYQLTTLNNICVFLAIGENENNGCIIGLGADQNESVSIEKALVESLFRLTSDSPKPDLNAVISGPKDHFNHHLSNSNLKNTLFLNNSSRIGIVKNALLPELDIKWTVLGNLSDIFIDLNLTIVKGESEKLQNMYYGHLSKEVVNLKRLNSFSNRNINFYELETLIHPIG